MSFLRRVVANRIQSLFSACYQSLVDLPVGLLMFDDVPVNFQLKFTDMYFHRRALYVEDFRNVYGSIQWLEEKLNKLASLVWKMSTMTEWQQDEIQDIEDVAQRFARGWGFSNAEGALGRLQDVIRPT